MSGAESLEDKIAKIMAGQFSPDLTPMKPTIAPVSSVPASFPVPAAVSKRNFNIDDDSSIEDVSHDEIYRGEVATMVANPAPKPRVVTAKSLKSREFMTRSESSSPVVLSSNAVSAKPVEEDKSPKELSTGPLELEKTIDIQVPQNPAVQILPNDIPDPSPINNDDDTGDIGDVSFLGVVDESADNAYELSISDVVDNQERSFDEIAAMDSLKLSSALVPKATGTSLTKPLSETKQKPVLASRYSQPAVSSASNVRSKSLSASPARSTGGRDLKSASPTTGAGGSRSFRSNTQTPQQSQPATPVRNNSGNTLKDKDSKGQHPPLPSSTRFTTPSRATPSRNSTDRQRAVSPESTGGSSAMERVIRLAVRVRPFSQQEKDQGARRAVSKVGNDIVIVNPNSFEAEPDTIAAAAIAVNNSQWAHAFSFDHCLWSYDIGRREEKFFDQVSIHEHLGLEIVENVLNGVSCSCFAFGHTTSGKTFTIFGPPEEEPLSKSSRFNGYSTNSSARKAITSSSHHHQQQQRLRLTTESGLVPRVFHDVVKAVKENLVTMREGRIFFSYYAIYNDLVVDLLVDPPAEPPREDQQDSIDALRVREHPVYGPYVENLRRVEVFTVEDTFSLIAEGDAHRATILSTWNVVSSRMHVVASLELTSVDINEILRVDPTRKVLLDNSQSNIQSAIAQSITSSALQWSIEGDRFRHDGSGRVIKVQLVDLAGSEKESADGDIDAPIWTGSTYNDTTPNRKAKNTQDKEKKELKLIRRSLTTLGFIIQSLAKGASFKSLPYRDSTLTFLLRDALNGHNHTTVIATISPAHTHFEESLATLRYVEKLTALRKKSSVPLGLSISKAAMKEPRAVLIDNFRKFHHDLDANHKGTLMQRQILQQTVADPQQRIAKLTRGSNEASISVYSARKPNQPTPYNNGGRMSTADLSFTSPLDGSIRRLRDVTADDLAHLQSSYRDLQGQLLELQIDMDSVRTDRDTLVVELRATRDRLAELEDDRDESRNKAQNLGRGLKSYETEIAQLRASLKRKEEENERLLTDLTEQKQARMGSDQAYHARTKEFLARFDSIKKENKALQSALELANNRDGQYGNERADHLSQIQRLKQELAQSARCIEDDTHEIKMLRQEVDLLRQGLDAKERVEDERDAIDRDRADAYHKLDGLYAELHVVVSERDSLLAMIKQKDNLLWLQSQQSEASIKMLQQRQAALERVGAEATSSSQDFNRLLDSLRELFHREDQVFGGSESGLDTQRLILLIRELKEKIILFDRIETEYHALETRYQTEATARQHSEEKFYELSRSLQSAEHSNAELSKQLVDVHRDLEATKRKLIAAVGNNQNNLSHSSSSYNLHQQHNSHTSTTHTTHSNGGSNRPLQQSEEEMLELYATIKQLKERLEHYQRENAELQVQADRAHKDADAAKEEVKNTQATMQREFAALWMSVQELNKLDALKDKSIQELIAERSQLTLERDAALERLRSSTIECEELRRELEEVDRDLQRAAGLDRNMLSSGQPLSLPQLPQQPPQQQPYSIPQPVRNGPIPVAAPPVTPFHQPPYHQQPPVQYQQAQFDVDVEDVASVPPPSPQTGGSATKRGRPAPSQQYPYQQTPQSQQQPRSRRNGGGGGSDDYDDDVVTEKILMHQIEELTGFLHDEERLKRVRLTTRAHQQQHSNSNSNSNSNAGFTTPAPSTKGVNGGSSGSSGHSRQTGKTPTPSHRAQQVMY